MNKLYTLTTLPEKLQTEFLKNRVIEGVNLNDHRVEIESIKRDPKKGDDLFQAMETNDEKFIPIPNEDIDTTPVIWGAGETPDKAVEIEEFDSIIPRVEKSKEEQKTRTKDKAEVFTPSWVVNLQNNAGDDVSVYENAFNTAVDENGTPSPTGQYWEPSKGKVFTEVEDAVEYISLPRLEITCGEAPYLVSPYDTTTGDPIPVKKDEKYYRVGLLDRKLRVANETAKNIEEYDLLAKTAVKNIYGYEWQGDNLLIARLNLLNTYLEYRNEYLKTNEGNELTEEELQEIANIISWNIWQMDGLKMVIPNSCEEKCPECTSKSKKYHGHNGKISVINFKDENLAFEDFIKLNQ